MKRLTPGMFAAILIAFFALTASAVVSRVVFERLPHLEDEFAYLYQARMFARGDLYIDTPRPLATYWQPFLVDLDHNGDGIRERRFGKYTPGWPMVLAVGELLNASWMLNAWLAMLTIALVYRLGREIYNPETGAIAAILMSSRVRVGSPILGDNYTPATYASFDAGGADLLPAWLGEVREPPPPAVPT